MKTEDDFVTVYRDKAGMFRWRRQSANNRIVSDGAESYVNAHDALEAATALNEGVPVALSVDEED